VNSVIQIRDLERTYTLGEIAVHALRGVSFDVTRGEMLTVMGPSGSGKSTLMNILGCLDQPTGGSYILDGVEVAGLTDDQLAEIRNRRIGFVFQSFNLLARTPALAQCELPLVYSGFSAQDRRLRALAALESVGLQDRVDHQPSELSGGQQQRVAIARALVNEPAIILADEPTGNLDTRTSIEVMGMFQHLNRDRGITILVITHEHDIAEYATRVVSCRDGLVVSDHPVRNQRIADDELKALPQEATA
jgi:putative ABC transport system ATP-binding protein